MKALGKPFWFTLTVVLLVKVLFLVTYPLNVSGDGFTYFRMVATRSSNLTHASGYPFLIGLPLAIPRAVVAAVRPSGSALLTPPGERQTDAPVASRPSPPVDLEVKQALMPLLALYVGIANHLMDVLAVICLFLLLRAIFSVSAAVVGVLVYALNPWNVQWATLSRPEQVQSNLIVLMLGVFYYAHRATRPGRKRLGYAVASALFVMSVLAKFNAALMVVLPVVALAVAPTSWGERVRLGLISLIAGAGVYGVFVVLYHAPSTGTYDLSYGQGHALYVRLGRNPIPLFSPENGLASKKFAILTRMLPPEPAFCCGPTLFSHVDWVPPEERRPYREQYLPLLRSGDEAAVRRLYAAVKDRPAGEWTSIYYYLGLKEGDQLMRAVFYEGIHARPAVYLAGAWRLFFEVFVERQEALVPVVSRQLNADPPLYVLAEARNLEPLRFGFVRLATSEYRSRELGYKGSPAIWLPGVMAVDYALVVTRIPPLVAWLLIGAGLLLALVDKGEPGRDPEMARWGPAVVVASLLVFVAAWALLFNIRNKDMRLIQPLLDALVAVGLWRIGGWVRRVAPDWRRAWS